MTDCTHNDKSKYVDYAQDVIDLRREVMGLRTENAELRVIVREIAELNTFDSDYAGRCYTFCAYCKSDQEGRGEQHEADCLTIKSRAFNMPQSTIR